MIEELITEKAEVLDKEAYYDSIVNTIIEIGSAENFIIALAELIQRLVVDHLHILGDIYDRGPAPHFIMDRLMQYHSLDIQWGNHDVVWMGAAAGQKACIATVVRNSIRYGKEYPLRDNNFPTVDWKHPYELTAGEKEVMDKLSSAFRNCEKLQNHIRLLLDKGGLYTVYNGNLLFHGSIPLNEDGTFREVQIYGKSYKGKELYDVLETYVRRAFYSVGKEEQKKGRDIMWYIWAAPNSPLFGKSKMSTFERYFIEDPSTHEEKKNAYYRLWENEEVVDNMLREFGLDPEKGHIINGHVPVHQSEGESPVKCDGKVIVIDGGFSKPYQKVTGIAGYTLIYNSYGLNLTAHEPFTSKADAVARETDILSNRVAVSYISRRQLVGDTDTGHALKERIQELIQLLDAYRTGIIKEKK